MVVVSELEGYCSTKHTNTSIDSSVYWQDKENFDPNRTPRKSGQKESNS
jgi:hypothetical protein